MSDHAYTERQKESLKLWIELIRYSSKLEQIIDDNLRQSFGQNISRFDVLSQLERKHDKGLTVGELAQRLIASKGNITGLLDRMEKDGLVTRKEKPEDRRSFQINITNKGLKLFDKMADQNAIWVEQSFGSIDLDNMKEMTHFLSDARQTLDKS
ncbi:MAG: MarR family transcriptional regulator [Proteobacteria bacterium]|jgi:DNA-binding MarR family transcriptional regulator|nr:MarR family transcriptional regulator [Pseudomonadota bacterium]